jgi:hypothetical protein
MIHQRYPEKSWTVGEENNEWYFFDDRGFPYGPFDTEEEAQNALDDYDNDYYR